MPTELLICVLASELPLDGSLRSVASLLPRVDFVLEQLSTGDASVMRISGHRGRHFRLIVDGISG